MERSLARSEARELGAIDVVTNDVGYQLPRHSTLLDAPHPIEAPPSVPG